MRRLHLWLLALLTPMLWGPRAMWLSQERLPAPDPRVADLDPGHRGDLGAAMQSCLPGFLRAKRRPSLSRRSATQPIFCPSGAGIPVPPGPGLPPTAREADPEGPRSLLNPYGSALPPPGALV